MTATLGEVVGVLRVEGAAATRVRPMASKKPLLTLLKSDFAAVFRGAGMPWKVMFSVQPPC
jgi:hypothetical protein